MNTEKAEKLKAAIRHMAEHWSQYQADGIDARIPPESTHPSAIEARKWTALARSANTELDGSRYIQDALVHLKDFEQFDAAVFGGPFKNNSEKVRQVSPIRVAIAKQLKKDPSLKNLQLFRILASKPPKGWTFYETKTTLGRYIDGPGGGKPDMAGMSYSRFSDVCKEERDKLIA